ncbi:MAG: cyclic nucleotide-binding domain-containing protein [Pseudomonadota bacterium]
MTQSIADLCRDLPVETFEPGAVLMAEGGRTGRMYVLLDGALEIAKGDFQINVVADRGAIFGDMSVLLGIPHMATVRALERSTAHVVESGEAFLKSNPDIAYLLAKILAQRLHGVTGYLVDLKRQFEDEQSHLGMVDEILESLVHDQGDAFTPGSDRDPG